MNLALPRAPRAQTVKLRGGYSTAAPDYVVDQNWGPYSGDEHRRWAALLERQIGLLGRYGAPQVLAGLESPGVSDHVPRFEAANRILRQATGREVAGQVIGQ